MRLDFLARRRRTLVALTVVLILPLLLVWLVLPLWLRGFVETQASVQLGRQVTIRALRVNPLRLSAAIDGLAVAGAAKETAQPQLKLEHAEVNADIRSLFRLAPVIEAVELQGLQIQLARLADGRYDIDDVLARLKPAQARPDAEPARFALYNLRLTDGSIRFDDRPKGRVHEVRALQLGLPFLSNLEDAVDVKVEPHLAFQFDGAAFDTGAQATPFAHDRAGTLNLKTGDIDVTGWLPYLPADLPLRPVAGQLAVDLSVQFRMPPDANPQVVVKGELRAKGIRIADAAGSDWVRLKALSVQLADAEPLRRQIALGSVNVEGLDVMARRDEAGRLSWLQALAAGQEPASSEPAPAAVTPPWKLSVSRLALRDGGLRWQDESVRPASRLAMEGVQAELENLQWPPADGKPARLKAQARLSNGDRASLSGAAAPAWQATGEWTAAGGRLQLQGTAWPLGWAEPYLASRLKPRVDGRLGFDLAAVWQGAPGEQTPTLQLASLQVDDFRAAVAGDKQPALGWKQLRLADVTLDVTQHGLSLGELVWQQPVLRARRDAGGQIDLLQWWQAPGSEVQPPPKSGADADSAWHVQVKKAAVSGGRLAWQDAATREATPVSLELQALALELRDLGWPAAASSSARLQGSAQVSSGATSGPGRLSWQGEIGQSPWSWRGSTRIERFPVHAVAAYAGPLPVAVAHADLGWTGQVTARAESTGLRLALQGDARVGDLRLFPLAGSRGASGGDELLSWQVLELPKLRVEVVPGQAPKVEMGEGRLTDFYARLLVDEAGRFNLADLNATTSRAAAAPASAASAAPPPAPVAAASAPAFELSVAGLQLANGRVDFSDHFIRPNYSAALSDLGGRIGAFRTGTREMAPLELRGRVAGTAQLEIRGSVNPTAKPLALDVQAKASDLELAPLSPYAGKYAGYAIERGKLSMDVSYRIDADGHLDARNQIVLNQLTFGDRIESPDATKLPVQLAVALLKDRNGVIDLDLPIGGSLNDPEFSIGGVVLKLIANLLTKAVTSPFALLTGGGAEDLSQVEFVPGTARLAPNAAAALDKVARSLADRPGLQMTVTGAADPVSEREAIQAAWLDERLAAERRKEASGADVSASAPATAPSAWPAEERARLVRRLYADTKLPNKPRNVLGLAKDISPIEMEALLRASYLVSTDNARELALQRGLAVRDALIAKGLPSERMFLAAPKLRAAGEDEGHWSPRVQLSLATP
jgi:uncharacterized protein involved in outer membrane biogenesis